tara:strand:- start:3715 stop:3999 length:285 start_codon:yes stop_codon:yes gene_type:complete
MKKKAKIYIPTKTAMQSGYGKTKKWVLEYINDDNTINPLMGWESTTNTLSEIKLYFDDKDQAINYANRNKIDYVLIDNKNRTLVKKSYTDNFIK